MGLGAALTKRATAAVALPPARYLGPSEAGYTIWEESRVRKHVHNMIVGFAWEEC